jgi:hypothetical protein
MVIWLAVGSILAAVLVIEIVVAIVYYRVGYNRGWEDASHLASDLDNWRRSQ